MTYLPTHQQHLLSKLAEQLRILQQKIAESPWIEGSIVERGLFTRAAESVEEYGEQVAENFTQLTRCVAHQQMEQVRYLSEQIADQIAYLWWLVEEKRHSPVALSSAEYCAKLKQRQAQYQQYHQRLTAQRAEIEQQLASVPVSQRLFLQQQRDQLTFRLARCQQGIDEVTQKLSEQEER